jgi:hypothetical protein
MLKQNNTLEGLDLSSNNIGPEGAIAIADSLLSNDSMKTASVTGNQIGNDGTACFAHILMINTAIESLLIRNFGKDGLKAFVANSTHMRGLKDLSFWPQGL